MDKVFFVTSNERKVITSQKKLNDIELIYYRYDLIEPRSESLEEIAKYKVLQAYEQVNASCIALDCGFYIESLKGWPGTYINFNLAKLGLNGILSLLSNQENRNAYFKECLAYYDGKEIKYFYGIDKGIISPTISKSIYPNQWSLLWKIFIPNNCIKTLAEMSDEERQAALINNPSSLLEFNNWVKNLKYPK